MIKAWTTPVILVVAAGLAGCDENGEFSLASPAGSEDSASATAAAAGGGEVIERDVESPEVFEAAEAGLWDGRPSLGGVWVAHPDVSEPERVLIRNAATGSEVIGALFRRERANPGPRIQVSSDAAAELGMLAGQPVELAVVALRREVIEVAPPAAAPVDATAESLDAGEISTASLDPIAAAAAAIDEAEAGAVTAVAATAPMAAPSSAPAAATAPATAIDRAYVQIGIFSVEANANNTAASLRNVGIVPTVLRQESRGKEFWRVIVGPATSTQERATLLRQVKDLGFADAYFVSS
jgi:cell division septation protein DedD